VLARAGLGILAARWLADSLGAYAFGFRQLTTVVVSVVLVVGLLGGVLRIAAGPIEGLRRDPTLLPAFVAAEPARVGPYRVVLLEETEGIVRWDVTEATGPAMLGFGTVPDAFMSALLDDAIGATVSGADPSGGTDLGLANVRYLVIAEGAASPGLVSAINRQPELEPLPAGDVRVWRVRSWVPRAVAFDPARAQALQELGTPGDTRPIEEDGLRRVRPGRYAGPVDATDGGLLVLSEGSAGGWRAVADGERVLTPVDLGSVQGFALEPGDERVVITLRGGLVHLLVVAAQLLLVAIIASLALRPPGTRRRRASAPASPGSLTDGPELITDPNAVVVPRSLVDRPLVPAVDAEHAPITAGATPADAAAPDLPSSTIPEEQR
jgi:hypothetical protein